MATTPETWGKMKETRHRLENCWKLDIDWSLFPDTLKHGCEKVGSAMNLPPTAVLCGYVVLGSFVLSPSIVKVPNTDWTEPVLAWLTVSMPTGSGKSTLFRHLYSMVQEIRMICGVNNDEPTWVFDDASFEKMGALMSDNSCRLLGFYDEMSAFLTQINLYRGRGLSDSHELSLFLQLYNAHPWRRDTVSGDANFAMSSTQLTVGGFTQPGVARGLIEMPANSEKGFSHRFLWFFPNPLFEKFSSLGEVDREFVQKMTNLLARQWRKPDKPGQELSPKVFSISSTSTIFSQYYDEVQELLKSMAGMDQLLPGMLSKSRGQVLRIATILHVLFSIDNEEDITCDSEVSEVAVKAAVNFVQTACQQTAFIVGKGLIQEEVQAYKTAAVAEPKPLATEDDVRAGYCLTLPGKTLYLSPLLALKKFRNKGNKDGAVRSFYRLQDEGFGRVKEIVGSKGATAQFEFTKAPIPSSKEGRVEFAKKLSKYNISLSQYENTLTQAEIKPMTSLGLKRKHQEVENSEEEKNKSAKVSSQGTPSVTSPKNKKNKNTPPLTPGRNNKNSKSPVTPSQRNKSKSKSSPRNLQGEFSQEL